MRSFILAVVLGVTGLEVMAQEDPDGNAAILARGGTLGLGLELGRGLSERWALRLSGNTYNYDDTITESNVRYDATLDLRSAGLIADWHPFKGAFRFSWGVMYNGAKFSVLGQPTGGTFELNNTVYNASQIGSLSGRITFKSFAPMFAVGWGNVARKGFAYSVDLGVLYQGNPKVELGVTCGSGVSCNQLQNDVAAEQAQLQRDLDGYTLWPVIHAGVGWVF